MAKEDKDLLLKDLCARLPYGVRGKVKADDVDTSKHDIDGFPLEITFDVDAELLRIDTSNDEIFVSTFDDNEDLGNYIEECQIDGTPWTIDEFTPYLRPMSSMTEEERKELINIRPYFVNENNIVIGVQCNSFEQISECQDWLNRKMFDYRGLIERGLAIEAPEGMYK